MGGTVIFGLFSDKLKIPTDTNIVNLAEESFAGNKYLPTALTIPSNISSIGSNAFKSCASLTSVDVQNPSATIGATCFSDCVNLSRVTLPSNLTQILSYVFSKCALESITIPATVKLIDDNAFGSIKSDSFEVTFSEGINLSNLTIHERAFNNSKVKFNLPWTEAEHAAKFGSASASFGATGATFIFKGGNN